MTVPNFSANDYRLVPAPSSKRKFKAVLQSWKFSLQKRPSRLIKEINQKKQQTPTQQQ